MSLDPASLETTHFRWAFADGVGTITLNRPERKNPLTFDSYAELRDLFRALASTVSVRVLVLAGAGGNFCSGGDVHEIIGPLTKMDVDGLHEFTRMNRNAVFVFGAASLRSLAMARIAPAPAQTPSTAAMIGCGQARIWRTRSPVMRVKSMRSGIAIRVSGSMISNTSPPEEKLCSAPVSTTARTSLAR